MVAWLISGSVILVVLSCNVNSYPLLKQALDPTSDGSGDDATIKPRSSYYGSKLASPKPEAPREIGYNTPAVEKRPPVKSGSSPAAPEGSSRSFTINSYGSTQPSNYNPVSNPVGTGFVESSSPPASAQGSSKPSAPMPEFPWLVPPYTRSSRKFPRGSATRQPSPIASVYGSSTAPQYLSGEGASEQDYWAVAPPMPSVSQGDSRGLVAHDSRTKQPASVGYMHTSPPVLQPGEYTQVEGVLEHGSHESEVEDSALGEPKPPASLSRRFGRDPTMDMFLRGYYPPGVISHHSRSFEQGRDHWEDSYYARDQATIGPDMPIQAPIGPDKSIQAPGDPDKPFQTFQKDTGSSQQQSSQVQEISSHMGSGYETVEPALFNVDYTTDVGGYEAVFWAKPGQSVGEYGAGPWDNPGYSAVGSTTDVGDYGTDIQANPVPGYSGVGSKTNVGDYGYWDEQGMYHPLYRPLVQPENVLYKPHVSLESVLYGPGVQPESVLYGPGVQPESVLYGPGVQPESVLYGPGVQPESVLYGPGVQPESVLYGPDVQPEPVLWSPGHQY